MGSSILAMTMVGDGVTFQCEWVRTWEAVRNGTRGKHQHFCSLFSLVSILGAFLQLYLDICNLTMTHIQNS